MRPGWGIGIIVSVLVSVAVYLFGIISISGLLSMALLLSGAWTVIAAFAIVEPRDRNYYLGWGVVVGLLSLSYFISLTYTIGLILLAIVALILVQVYLRPPKMYGAATAPTPSGRDTPAASAI
jgi:hypothetical protein